MNLSKGILKKVYELVPAGENKRSLRTVIFQKRIIVGSSDSCDLFIRSSSVSPVHAVVEISESGGRVYDMNSETGTKVNGARVICQDINVGDKISFGAQEFSFKEYQKSSSLPPVLGSGTLVGSETKSKSPVVSDKIKSSAPKSMPFVPTSPAPNLPREDVVKETPMLEGIDLDPQRIIVDDSEKDDIPYISYPLAKDPNTEFSEYIFEDAGNIYPIFKWSIENVSAEVIILHKGRIFSVDYLPDRKEPYHIKGWDRSRENIEFPSLGKKESIPFVSVNNGVVSIENSIGYKGVIISDELKDPKDFQEKNINIPVVLKPQDILKLQNGDLQIFIRNSQSPPKIKPAPLFRRDNESRKYFVLILVPLLLFLGFISGITIDKEKEKEKQPDRIAKIIYNRKKYIAPKRSKAVAKTKKLTTPKESKKTAARPISDPKPKPSKKVKPAKQPKPKLKAKSKTIAKPKPIKKAKPTPTPPKRVVKKAKPKAAKKTVAKSVKKRSTKKTGATRGSPRKSSNRKARPSKGHVDTFKLSSNLTGNLSKVLAKGKKGADVQVDDHESGGVGITGGELGGSSGSVERLNVSKDVGSLSSAASGKLAQARGAEGLVSKKSVAVAGIPSDTVVEGSYDASLVADILREHLSQFQYCYQKELDRDNKASGKIRMVFTIGASGSVKNAAISESALPSSVERCVVGVLRGIQFPAPMGGGIVKIRQPMHFEPKRR